MNVIVLDALVAWRRSVAALSTVSFYHQLDRTARGTQPGVPFSFLSLKLEPSDVRAVVPFALTERVVAPGLVEAEVFGIQDILAELRTLHGKASYTHGAAIHQHQLQLEDVGVDRTGNSVAVLTWAGRASWIEAAPRADFTYAAGRFTDASTGAPTAWDWSFGSTVQNPVYTPPAPATITLTARNRFGWSTKSIAVTP